LWAAARRIAGDRTRLAEEGAIAEHRRRQEAEIQARAQHLSALAERGEHALARDRGLDRYAERICLQGCDTSLDLCEIAAKARERGIFTSRLAELHCRHARKGQLIARLKAAGL
jgi:hypothetical protein